MAAEKTMWQKPAMTVLSRSRPEEVVLGACKMSGGIGSSASKDIGCMVPSCSLCNVHGTS